MSIFDAILFWLLLNLLLVSWFVWRHLVGPSYAADPTTLCLIDYYVAAVDSDPSKSDAIEIWRDRSGELRQYP